MKRRAAVFSFLTTIVLLATLLPATAGEVYDNGPIGGSIDAWTINFGFAVSDSFTVANNSTITGLTFAAWVFPGDVLTSAEVSITSEELGGTTYFDQVVTFTQSNCSPNQYAFNVCHETANFAGPALASGTYWLNLQNAIVPDGDPAYWDESDGPSQASTNDIGTIPSESFTLYGDVNGSTPEPGTLLLITTGVLGLAGSLRRRYL